jgi:hypothetical protein
MLHYTGKLIRVRKQGFIPWMTRTGLIISVVVFVIVSSGTLIGRYNFRTDEVVVKIKNLPLKLDGLKIIQISDLHLASFYHHHSKLKKVVDRINSYQPDLILNTGDFVTYGWREFNRADTILAKEKSRFGNFAILGNHDMGTYLPNATNYVMNTNIIKMKALVESSGYRVLYENNTTVIINGAKVEIIGVKIAGRYPNIIHGDLIKAMENPDTAEFKILLAHDPNQWRKDVAGKTDINLTLSGHTHGFQVGILTRKFRWSPAKYIYHEWAGLYSENDQFLYVNRGLGVLAVPFRIWMPPEITLLTLKRE